MNTPKITSQKIQKRFVDKEFGFPVILRNVPLVKARGVWTPHVDYNHLSERVVNALARKKCRLSGNEIRFIRNHFTMTLQRFGKRFDVSHVAVLKWEHTRDDCPSIKWPVEKDMRLFILDQLNIRPSVFKQQYASLQEPPQGKAIPLEINLTDPE